MFYRLLALLFGISALIISAAAIYLCFRPIERLGLEIEQPERFLKEPVVGREYEIDFRVVNHTGLTLQVVGGGFS